MALDLFSFFRQKKPSSAEIAKERLQIIVAHGGRTASSQDFLPRLEKDILEVVRKYIKISEDQINVSLDKEDDCEMLGINISLSERVEEPSDEPHPHRAPAPQKPYKSTQETPF